MAISVTVALESVCDGGGHAFVSIAVDGGPTVKRELTVEELRAPLTGDEKEDFIRLALRAAITGLTRVQARNKLQAGVTVSIA